ncbi:unnamed protein product [Polarella glacialis]|uniref:Uncharacterized protein n=1 Tax=Polarella glacialis TaxID=89957 RepID=A0A813FD53_POLGL|nr:unnamed protein product [Polarella glacialis]
MVSRLMTVAGGGDTTFVIASHTLTTLERSPASAGCQDFIQGVLTLLKLDRRDSGDAWMTPDRDAVEVLSDTCMSGESEYSEEEGYPPLIPAYVALAELDESLAEMVREGIPGGGEFLSWQISDVPRAAEVVCLLICHGFLPMGEGAGLLLPKLHHQRCVLRPTQVHVGRKVRRHAGAFRLTVDRAWSQTCSLIQKHTFTQEPGDCWLSDQLIAVYEAVAQLSPEQRKGVAFHSVELWHADSDRLVAGEIGYTCGGVYSSCTGFALKDDFPGAGILQLVALGCWLAKCGFGLWDLGMEIAYKLELGAVLLPRAEWSEQLQRLRTTAGEKDAKLHSPSPADGIASNLLVPTATTTTTTTTNTTTHGAQPTSRDLKRSREEVQGAESQKSRPRKHQTCAKHVASGFATVNFVFFVGQ